MYLKVSFPSGRFYGAEMHDPSLPEWPPHPSRLYSALVASAYQSGRGMTEERRQALEWLEQQLPPKIVCPEADLAEAPVSFVPTGDTIGRKGKKGEEQYEHPIYRWRQPRHFPCAIILGEPVLYYYWAEDPAEKLLSEIDKIASGVTHIGTSHSLAAVSAHAGKTAHQPSLCPSSGGSSFLRTILPGRLKELDAIYGLSSWVRRPVSACEPLTGYAPSIRQVKDVPGPQFIGLRLSGTLHGADTAAYLARSVRKAVMSVIGDDAPPVVHGHGKGAHMGWLPLPDVGHPYASGRIVGIGIMIPSDTKQEDRNKALSGIGQVQDIYFSDGRVGQLNPLVPGERVPVALMSRTWTAKCRTWASVTPVVLDRPPKKLTEERVCKAVVESLLLAGFPKPLSIKVSSYSFFKGAPSAFRVQAQKPRFHAVVRFENPVKGPVIAGRLRYFGVGLFRPVYGLSDTGEV